MEHKHEVDWDEAEVVQEPRYWKSRVLEAIDIKKHTRNTNLDWSWTPSGHHSSRYNMMNGMWKVLLYHIMSCRSIILYSYLTTLFVLYC